MNSAPRSTVNDFGKPDIDQRVVVEPSTRFAGTLLPSAVPVAVTVLFKARLVPVDGALTVTILVSVNPPSIVVALIVALPAAIAVTSPSLFTVAMDVLLLL